MRLPLKSFSIIVDTHSYHQASVGGTTSFISSFYSDFAFIMLLKQINLFRNNCRLSTVDWVSGKVWWNNKFIRKKFVAWNMVRLVFQTPRWFQLYLLVHFYDGLALRQPSLSLQWAAPCRSYWAMLNPFLIFHVVSKHSWWVTNSENSTLRAEPWITSLDQEETLNRTSHTIYTISVPLLLANTQVHQCFKGWMSVSTIHMCVPVLRVNKGYV